MISINVSNISTAKLTDRSAVSLCLLGAFDRGTGLSGIRAAHPASSCPSRAFPSAMSAMSDRPRHWEQ